MNKLVKMELTKIARDTGISFDDNTTQIFIKKSGSEQSSQIEQNKVYSITIADYVINPPSTFSLAETWNNGTKPTLTQQKVLVVQILGKMIKVQSLDENWTGWLPSKAILNSTEIKEVQ